MTASTVVKIKVHRNRAGSTIPFDAIYLFDRNSRDLIPDIWGYAMVLPLEKEVIKQIYNLTPHEFSHFQFKRNDDVTKAPTGITDEGSKKETEAARKKWWDALFAEHGIEDRVVVIPILTSRVKGKLRPRYLSANKWFDTQLDSGTRNPPRSRSRGYASKRLKTIDAHALNPAISDLAYLATPYEAPNDKIRPICGICPRNLEHIQGKCIPGMPICYKSLDFGDIRTDKQGPDPEDENASVQ